MGMGAGLRQLLTLLVAIFILSCKSKATAIIHLAVKGESAFTIVLPDAPSGKEERSATILAAYFSKVTGARLPIITETRFTGKQGIYIGKTRKTATLTEGKILADGLAISSSQHDVFLQGGSGQGILYATYTFIEKYLGCRKYDAGPAFCPAKPDLTLLQDLTDLENPAFIYRESYYPMSDDAEYLLWHKLQKFEDLWGLWGHSFFKIIAPETYFASNPEYFSLVNGKRVARQLCLSNPQVLQLAISYLKKAIAKNQDATYWSVAQNDGNGFCTCERCRKTDFLYGSHQGSILQFVNSIAAIFPDQNFTTLAYDYSSHAPVGIRPAKNVIILLSSIEAERQKPLQHVASGAGFRKNLIDWGGITNRLFVWNYTTQFTNYLAPFADYNNLIPDLKYMQTNHVSGVFEMGSGETYSDLAELNSYVQAKGLWNQPNEIPISTGDLTPAQSGVDLAFKDFINGYYGAAAPYISNYLMSMQKEISEKQAVLSIYGNPVNNDRDYLSAGQLTNYEQQFTWAEAAVKNSPIILARVKRAHLPITYARLQSARSAPGSLHGYIEIIAGKQTIKSDFLPGVIRFIQECSQAGAKEIAEAGLTPAEYLMQWQHLLQLAPVINLAKDASVTLFSAYSAEYPAKGAKTLTDGGTGSLDYSFNWLFMYGNDLDAVIDMGTLKKINTIGINFLDDQIHNIYLPSSVILMTSLDGIQYKPYGSDTYVLINNPKAQINHQVYAGSETIRYIKITARCQKAIPSFRPYSAKKPALCCDEVMVQ